ncbi:MAG: flagellar basal body P-ring protein FlgI [Planctomycetota bacterium]|nr:flagellar basal body P-ring protein FlgI [Planctomycetota bacterium]
MRPRLPSNRCVWTGGCLLGAALAGLAGCTSSVILPNPAETPPEVTQLDLPLDTGTTLLKEVVSPWGMNYLKIESVGLVTGLHGTGSDPPPSPQRSSLMSDMQTHEVKNPNQVLASPNVSLVVVRAFLPPGMRKGDRFDVEVRVPARSETTSLRDGWLMSTRLREVAVLDDQALHTGRVDAMAEGQVIVDAAFEGATDQVSEIRGRAIGGGVALTSRTLGLMVRSENHSIKTSTQVGTAINARFHTYDQGIKRGVATPKRDNFVELEVHARYKHNISRYLEVVKNIALTDTPTDRLQRLVILERKLFESSTAAAAALQLEAIGKEAIPVLEKALRAEDPETRFYAVEALAYLDDARAAEPLAQAAREQPAFRWHAIAALCAMENVSAYDALSELLHVSSAETRYAAFRALRTRNPQDPLVKGEHLTELFTLHTISTSGPPLIHFSRTRYNEIVLFGDDQRMRPPAGLNAGKSIIVKGEGADRIRVTRFAPKQEDKRETCSTKLSDVIRTIAKVGGGYADVLEALQEAKQRQYLDGRVVIDALPRSGRVYRRDQDESEEPAVDPAARKVRSPLPELFNYRPVGKGADADSDTRTSDDIEPDTLPDEKKSKGVFGKLGELLKAG